VGPRGAPHSPHRTRGGACCVSSRKRSRMHLTVVNATCPKSPTWSTADAMILGSLAAVHHLTDTKVVSCSPVDHPASSGRTRRIVFGTSVAAMEAGTRRLGVSPKCDACREPPQDFKNTCADTSAIKDAQRAFTGTTGGALPRKEFSRTRAEGTGETTALRGRCAGDKTKVQRLAWTKAALAGTERAAGTVATSAWPRPMRAIKPGVR
jgi:hypothetical protein